MTEETNRNTQKDVQTKTQTDAAQALIDNTEQAEQEAPVSVTETTATDESEGEEKVFRKYKIKDIVFLAIMAACMLVTGSIMPLVGSLPVFGIVQVCLGLQFSVFPTIGMMKVRKPGALLFMSLVCGAVFAFMFLPMFVCIVLCAVVAEGLTLLIFRGYRRDGTCLFAGTVYFPVTLPLMWGYYNFLYSGEENLAFMVSNPWVAAGMSAAVVAICFVGALIGMLISRELKKAGVLKK